MADQVRKVKENFHAKKMTHGYFKLIILRQILIKKSMQTHVYNEYYPKKRLLRDKL